MWYEEVVQLDSFASSFLVSQYHILKSLSSPLYKPTHHVNVSLFLSPLFCSIHLCVCCVPGSRCFGYCSFGIIVWNQSMWFLQHCSLSRSFRLFGAFCVSSQTLELFVLVLWKNAVKYFDRYCIEFVDCLGEYNFNNNNSSNP